MPKQIIQSTTQNKFIKALFEQTGGCISDACKTVGISRPTINNWRRLDSSFDQRVQEAIIEGKESLADLAESALKKRIESGDTTAIIFTLKSLRREHFGEKSQKEVEEPAQDNVIKTPHEALFHSWSRIFMVRATLQDFNLLTKDREEMLTKLYKDILNDKDYNEDKESS